MQLYLDSKKKATMWYALETINWLAKLQRTNDILTVTSALSNLYKRSLIKREDFNYINPHQTKPNNFTPDYGKSIN